ncbi:MAG: leucine-rich repeat protein [Eubacteriales bacterium]
MLESYIQAAKEKDEDALVSLYHATCDEVYTILSSVIHNKECVYALMPEVYKTAFSKLCELQSSREFLPMLYETALSLAYAYGQKGVREHRLIRTGGMPPLRLSGLDEWIRMSVPKKMFRNILMQLTVRQRDIVYLYDFKQHTIGEIAVILDTSIQAVQDDLQRAKHILHGAFDAEKLHNGHLSSTASVFAAILHMTEYIMKLPEEDAARILIRILTSAEHAQKTNDAPHADAPHADKTDTAAAHTDAVNKQSGYKKSILSFLTDIRWVTLKQKPIFITVTALAAVFVLLYAAGFMFGSGLKTAENDETARDSTPSPEAQVMIPISVQTQPENGTEAADAVVQPAVLACGTCGESAFYVLTDDGVLTIYGTGRIAYAESWDCTGVADRMEDHSVFTTKSLSPYRDQVTHIEIRSGITEIGPSFFMYASALRTVSIPETCRVIEHAAFYHCDRLEEIVLPPYMTRINDWTFRNCTNLRRVVFPTELQEIGAEAFCLCSSLSEIIYDGEKLNGIYSDAFAETVSLTEFTFPPSLTYLDQTAFRCCYLTRADLSACKNLRSTSVNVFEESGRLCEVILPDSLKILNTGMFLNCENLVSVKLGSQLSKIRSDVFSGTSLQILELPASVSDINKDAFSGTQELIAVYVDEDNPYFCDLDGVLYNRAMDTLVYYPPAQSDYIYTVPDTVTRIREKAFYNKMTNLEHLFLPDSVCTLESSAIYLSERFRHLYFSSAPPENWMDQAVGSSGNAVLHYPADAPGWEEESWIAPDGNTYPTSAFRQNTSKGKKSY